MAGPLSDGAGQPVVVHENTVDIKHKAPRASWTVGEGRSRARNDNRKGKARGTPPMALDRREKRRAEERAVKMAVQPVIFTKIDREAFPVISSLTEAKKNREKRWQMESTEANIEWLRDVCSVTVRTWGTASWRRSHRVHVLRRAQGWG